MPSTAFPEIKSRLTLWAECAADLMTPNPVSIPQEATLGEAIAVLADRGFSAAPVIDEAGRPVGVLSRADILIYHQAQAEKWKSLPGKEQREKSKRAEETSFLPSPPTVADLMTPAVFSVPPGASPSRVIHDLLIRKVRRLFVVDLDGTLIGVISALDVLRHLQP
jgi:CBS domain-containing protein